MATILWLLQSVMHHDYNAVGDCLLNRGLSVPQTWTIVLYFDRMKVKQIAGHPHSSKDMCEK